jgi:hypothetical protein
VNDHFPNGARFGLTLCLAITLHIQRKRSPTEIEKPFDAVLPKDKIVVQNIVLIPYAEVARPPPWKSHPRGTLSN